jgi:hypothetical protein
LNTTPNLTLIECFGTLLSSLNIQNGNNTNLTAFRSGGVGVSSTPNLNCIQVDNPAYMNANWSAFKNASATFALSCPLTPAAALNFDFANDYITVPYFARPDNFTLQVWVKKAPGFEGHIFNWNNAADPHHIYTDLFIQGGTGLVFYQENDGSSVNTVTNFSSITDDQWHQITVVRTAAVSNNVSMYIDGVLVNTGTANLSPATDAIRIGANDLFSFNGSIDELRIWNRTLCTQEITDYANCEITSARPGLMAVYNFNQGFAGEDNSSITTLTDASGNGRDGTLINFVLTGTSSNFIAPGGVVTGTLCIAPASATYYKDVDNDGYGDPSSSIIGVVGCTPAGYVLDNTDCNDNNAAVNAPLTWYQDFDGDGWGDDNVTLVQCTQPNDYVALGGDCDDHNAVVNPGAVDICDAVDNNCNGILDDNNSLNFDGVNDYVQMNDFNLGTSDFTVEAWVKPAGNGNFVIGNRTVESTGTGNWWNIRTDNNHLVLEMAQSTAPAYTRQQTSSSKSMVAYCSNQGRHYYQPVCKWRIGHYI